MTNILIIDDEQMVRMTLRLTLKEAGYEVEEAADGEEGMRKYKDCSPDLVITDIIMPEKEGIETIIEMRRNSPGQKIIAVSGGGRIGNSSLLDAARKLGADAILKKPFDPDDLLKLVKELAPNRPKARSK